MQHYVLGFAFDEKKQHVVLIQKKAPEWQKGKWNGVGGKMEDEEIHGVKLGKWHAMSREFKEETGLDLNWTQWTQYATLEGKGWAMHVFVAITDEIFKTRSCTDELVGIFELSELPNELITNLRWLIPMALDTNEGQSAPGDSFRGTIHYLYG